MVFFTWRERRKGLLIAYGIENIIIKFSRGFSKEVNFWISYFISFFEDLLGRFFLSSRIVFFKNFFLLTINTITNILPYMTRRCFSFITRFSIFSKCFNFKAIFKNIRHWLEHSNLSWENCYIFLLRWSCQESCLYFTICFLDKERIL